MNLLAGKRILLGVTGGIAAYKSAELIRRLQDQGADVHVAMTNAATEFITPLTLQALSGHPVHLDLLDTETESVMGHIELARWADLILIAPASANFIARLAQGHGDDLLSTICLAAQCQVAVAPAMNQGMWANQATQLNVSALIAQQITIFGPSEGLQACGEVGEGRLLDIAGIVDLTAATFPNERLRGRKVVITAGPTREAIDPVRYISNHSSGKQGYALAEAAIEAGAEVILISGPTSLTPPERARLIPVTSAREMHTAAMQEATDADIFIGVAAVADFRPIEASDQKIKKDNTGERLTLTLEENPDIIAAVAGLNDGPYTVGFAAETSHVIDHARRKLTRKKLNMIIANDVMDQNIGFNSDQNETTIIWGSQEQTLPIASKRTIATKIVGTIADALPEARQ
ncbi:MAG: bifunctional phosphopantothenoylcysteine decarboxylase/phosphopantothenate--cysteine ligase CoaBC [Gammaproteobacteria bacterium]|nr:bifunctional phosphopantothenoylcysteine decarboxylase/phosphopantothenate--cysteine ligase CoaBC [Gammaproteobacteria bacterium]OUU06443.1 MAG: bifunctional 4'-phosphopantothenoylcysteine decarboxylase/phosphopantothenoylcysteine synthetase [Gammaproteobacteria bacterium TMED34]